ncbi:zinc finger BED domain-containing protein 5-like [Palaemon carinicauda]|uniref:zinc finger BED domain-containing protein 5-like n=1 Tax=Palaemon carinicauda TaxID=392227 RepID=UPI0035B60691
MILHHKTTPMPKHFARLCNVTSTIHVTCPLHNARGRATPPNKGHFWVILHWFTGSFLRTHAVTAHIDEEVVKQIKSKRKFALQVDESTDIAEKCQLAGFCKFIDKDIVEQFMFCKELQTTTTGEDIFASVNSYLTQHGLSWNYCCGICTDGAPSMIGKYKDFITRALKENPSIITTHCFLHREALVAKTCGEELTEVLNQAVKMGRLEGIVTSVNKLKGFQRKLKSWKSAVQKDDVSNFPSLQQPGYKGLGTVKNLILNHLEQLREAVDKYFPSLSTEKLDWIVSPFELADMAEELDFTAIECDEFLDMSANSTLKVKFEKSDVTLAAFRQETLGEYLNLAKKAISLLLPFSTLYLSSTCHHQSPIQPNFFNSFNSRWGTKRLLLPSEKWPVSLACNLLQTALLMK